MRWRDGLISIAAVSTAFLVGLGLPIVHADTPVGFALGIQNGGTPIGAGVILNAGSGLSASISGGVATLSASGGGGLLLSNTVTITPAQLIDAATPITLVPAAGAGLVVFPVAIRWRLVPGAGPFPYQEPSDGGPYVWWQNNANPFNEIFFSNAADNSAVGFIQLITDSAQWKSGTQSSFIANPSFYTNQPLVLQPIGGDSLDRGPILTATINAPGTGYLVNDLVAPSGPSDFDGILRVTSVNGGGGVTGLAISAPGTVTLGGTAQPTMDVGNLQSATVTLGMGGTGYMNGDTGTVSGCGDMTGTYTVLTSTAGVVNTVSVTGGTQYFTQPNCSTTVTTGGGDGTLQLNVVAATGSGLTVKLTDQPGDGTLTITTWYTVAPE
jgi:hypothetical protein